MSEEKANLELLGTGVLTSSAEVRDLRLRFDALERRFSMLEGRFTAMEARLGTIETRLSGIENRVGGVEERMSALLAVVVRIAERLDGQATR
jgi:prophage DNA circulation protein